METSRKMCAHESWSHAVAYGPFSDKTCDSTYRFTITKLSQRMRKVVVEWSDNTFATDYPLLYEHNDEIGWNNPELIPPYVQDRVRESFDTNVEFVKVTAK